MRWLTDGCVEDLGLGACQVGAHADGTQIRDTLHGLPSLWGAASVWEFGYGD